MVQRPSEETASDSSDVPKAVFDDMSEPRCVAHESSLPSRETQTVSPESGPPSHPPGRKIGQFRGWRGWLARLVLLVVSPLLFFGILEAVLRIGGYGYPTGFFVGPDAEGKFTTNHRFGWRFFPRSLARNPEPCMLFAKPPGCVRIFVLGSSAALGTPNPSFSFGEILTVMLREQYPGTQFELINGAMTAINSHVALEIARDCAAHEPDLFIVYMGNNEVVGPYGPGTVFQNWSPSRRMIRSSLWVKSTRVGQLLENGGRYFQNNSDAPREWRGMEMFLENPVTSDDPRLRAVYENYRQNLTDICGIAHRAHAAVILSTVAVNLSDFPPLASRHRSDLKPEDLAQWESLYQAGGELEDGERWQSALEQYDAAAKIDDRFAELQFRLGHCLLKAGRPTEAQERFKSARDLDVLRFRADSRINAIVREVAAEQAAAGVRLVDAERALTGSFPDSPGTSDEDIFYEHVHFTFTGDYLLARAVLDQVRQALPQLAALPPPGSIPSRQRCAELLVRTPWDEFQSAADMLTMTARPPFTNQLHHSTRQAAARKKRDILREQAATPQAMASARMAYQEALARSAEDWRLHYRFGTLAMQWGVPDVAAEHLQAVVQKLPGNAAMQTDLAMALADLGQFEAAVAHLQTALKIDPKFADYEYNLGIISHKRERLDQAIAHFQKALELKPEFANAEFNLGQVLIKKGKRDEALIHFQKVLEIEPDSMYARHNLALLLAERGQLAQAIVEYQNVLATNPHFAEAQFNLGLVLVRSGLLDEAIVRLRNAMEIMPENDNVRRSLEAIQAERERTRSALAKQRQLLLSRPNDIAVLDETAWQLATNSDASLRNGPEAVQLALRAVELSEVNRPELFETLAAAYAEAGSLAQAVETSRKALNLATQPSQQRLAESIRARMQLYEAGRPYHELPVAPAR